MNKAIGVVLGLILVLAVGIGGALMLENTVKKPASQQDAQPVSAFDTARNNAINTAIDASGVKKQLASALNAEVPAIAAASGLDEAVVQQAVSDIDVENWSVTTLPSNCTQTHSFSGEYQGISATLTTYDSPKYVSVEAWGQDVTFAVPESAQTYMGLLDYLQ